MIKCSTTTRSRDRKGAAAKPIAYGRGSDSTQRSGSVAIEVLLMSPIVLGLIMAVIEISMMTAANEHLAAASREGCRVAALGGDVYQIQRAVYNHLGYGSLSSAVITIVFLQDGEGNPLPVVVT
ncbi:MAG: TadE/TadG family type IV pilus assembly protein, partial [Gemmataceae bacterium]